MASSFASNKETTNYARLSRLLVDVGTNVLKETFDRIHPPGSLHTVLTTAPVNATLTSMKKMKAISPTQWKSLMSPTVSSKDFDITLLVALLRNICGLSAPLTGWNSPPSSTDTTKAADIVRIRFHRNEVFAHAKRASVDDVTFNTYWVDIGKPLVRLGGSRYQAIINNLKTECMDPEREQCYQQKLKQRKEHEKRVMEELAEIEEKLDSIVQNLDEKSAAHSVEDVDVKAQAVFTSVQIGDEKVAAVSKRTPSLAITTGYLDEKNVYGEVDVGYNGGHRRDPYNSCGGDDWWDPFDDYDNGDGGDSYEGYDRDGGDQCDGYDGEDLWDPCDGYDYEDGGDSYDGYDGDGRDPCDGYDGEDWWDQYGGYDDGDDCWDPSDGYDDGDVEDPFDGYHDGDGEDPYDGYDGEDWWDPYDGYDDGCYLDRYIHIYEALYMKVWSTLWR